MNNKTIRRISYNVIVKWIVHYYCIREPQNQIIIHEGMRKKIMF